LCTHRSSITSSAKIRFIVSATSRDWFEWHAPYDQPGSALAARLELVKAFISEALDDAPLGEVRVVSMCAGQGRDVIGAVAAHARRPDVRARLVELDTRNAAAAAAAELANKTGLRLEIENRDASGSDAYAGAVPARIVLACGVFGNISDDDIRRCVSLLPMLCESGATVVWTRHRRQPDLTPAIRRWFVDAGFDELGFAAPPAHEFVGVGAARWKGAAGELRPGVSFFEWTDDPRPPP
jgi:hypothetical protein